MKKLSQRLQKIFDQLDPNLDLWDICCDHGILGTYAAIHKIQNKNIYFVDRVSSIIQKLKKLHEQLGTEALRNASYLAKDATCYDFPKISGNIIIAGIGENLSLEILKNILKQIHPPFKIIICINATTFHLRKFLSQTKLKLEKEFLIQEGRHIKEILVIGIDGQDIPALFGLKSNFEINSESQKYLEDYFIQMQKIYHYKMQGPLQEEAPLIRSWLSGMNAMLMNVKTSLFNSF